MIQGRYGTDDFGTSPYGSSPGPFGVLSAEATNPISVRVTFTYEVAPGDFQTTNPSNYVISPALTVVGVLLETPTSVLLVTSQQDDVAYTVTVSNVVSNTAEVIAPLLHEAAFTGLVIPTAAFMAVGVSASKVRLTFNSPMAPGATIEDTASYTIRSTDGSTILVDSVIVEGDPAAPTAVSLLLQPKLDSGKPYTVVVSPSVVSLDGWLLKPNAASFQWIEGRGYMSISSGRFSGEVSGGILGNPDGLVFFSPALDTAAANSAIQVDEVDVCTRAFDEYHFPSPPDPAVLYTYGGGKQGGVQPVLGTGAVLFARPDRLGQAKLTFGYKETDALNPYVDGPATATFAVPWDPDYVALLNNTYWRLGPPGFMLGRPSQHNFITAANLAPIPSGPTVTVVLQAVPVLPSASLVGEASVVADIDLNPWVASVTGTSEVLADLTDWIVA